MREVERLVQRLAELETRLRRLEDRAEILDLLMSYGPLADSGSAEATAALWEPGGSYDFGVDQRVVAPDELADLYAGSVHRGLMEAGAGHLTLAPHVDLDEDAAIAVGYSLVIRADGDRWMVWRAAANVWRLRRTPDGWRIVERRNRILDGAEAARELLRMGMGMAGRLPGDPGIL